MNRLPAGLLCVLLDCTALNAQTAPRSGWSLVAGAEDLVQNGGWSCLSGVSASAGSFTVSADSSGYNTVVNTGGLTLKVTGDFSVIATLSNTTANPGAFLTLVGTQGSGSWWNGLKRLDVGFSGNTILTNYWTGSSSNAVSATLGNAPSGNVTLEVSRAGSQFIVYANGAESGRISDAGIFASGNVYLGFNVAPSNSVTVTGMAAAVPAAAPGNASVFAPWQQVVARTGAGLRDSADQAGFLIGAAVAPSDLNNGPLTLDLGRNFNVLVATNAMKFGPTEPAPGQYSFCQADQLIAFAQANGMKVRGHNLVWQQSLPSWLTAGNYTPSQAADILKNHIFALMHHFKGKLILWDVVNEAIAYGSPYGWQPSYWLNQLGTGYVEQAFRWAHEADPDAKLYYNDTGGEGAGAKSDAVYNLVAGMVSRGVPIDGVGLQMHVSLNGAPKPSDVAANMARFAQLGLEVQITEMDVRLANPPSQPDLAAQATIYQNMTAICLAAPNCTAVLTWGVGDPDSWIPGAYPGFGSALLFDAQYQPRSAYSAVGSALAAAGLKPRIWRGGIVIHGGVAGSVSPGSLADIYGSAMATATVSAPGGETRLPVVLADTQVTVNGVAAPLIYVSGPQAIFQIPYETPSGTASVVVTSGGTASSPQPLLVKPAAPSILTYGANRAVVVNADGSINSPTACAAPGSVGVSFLIGSGPLDNPVQTGAIAPLSPLSRETMPVTVTLDGTAGEVTFAGLAPNFAGLLQLNFTVPVVPPGDHAMAVSIGGYASNQALMCVGK